MTTIIKRGGGIQLTPEARQRAKEHLLSVGYRPEQLEPIEWPDDAVSACRSHKGDEWKFTLKSDILREKINRMNKCLRLKRELGLVRRLPAYVWVFYVPGAIFSGWWTYLIGRGCEHGGKYQVDTDLICQAMEMFPVVKTHPVLFDSEYEFEKKKRWQKAFAKRYQCGTRGGKPQGKAPIWVEAKGNCIIKILGHGKWHSGKVVA